MFVTASDFIQIVIIFILRHRFKLVPELISGNNLLYLFHVSGKENTDNLLANFKS